MGDLVAAAKKQYDYAKNEYLSGDETKGDEHRAKAEAFIDRIASGEGAPTTNAAAADDGPLSDDMGVAHGQLLARLGYPVVEGATGPDAATLLGVATEEQARELAFLGVFGQPGAFPAADYSLFEQYYEPVGQPDEENGMQSWAPKAEYAASGSGWKHYINSKGS